MIPPTAAACGSILIVYVPVEGTVSVHVAPFVPTAFASITVVPSGPITETFEPQQVEVPVVTLVVTMRMLSCEFASKVTAPFCPGTVVSTRLVAPSSTSAVPVASAGTAYAVTVMAPTPDALGSIFTMCVPVTVTAVASTNAPVALNVFDSSCVASGRVILIEPL